MIYESFSRGIPVIGSNVGGIPELVKDNLNGFLFESGNVEQLIIILEKIINNPELLKELSKNALEYVKQYDMNKHIERLLEIYGEARKINR
ncbi:MAG: glycosyltransferase [Candidatus Margulisbacteria bacterium]|nr:glycosyltransferase [Candidatus Margulisiibacteriota bacterium]